MDSRDFEVELGNTCGICEETVNSEEIKVHKCVERCHYVYIDENRCFIHEMATTTIKPSGKFAEVQIRN
ncbi:hypothetical protein HHI36_008999 [Cryptolaemus montrouzieri]|uniref:Uncharacterized protein n=1 Tax=Cryptolaemus montrouzieri TaxID=559131 RepID=A0ABD2MU03_9CUCU